MIWWLILWALFAWFVYRTVTGLFGDELEQE